MAAKSRGSQGGRRQGSMHALGKAEKLRFNVGGTGVIKPKGRAGDGRLGLVVEDNTKGHYSEGYCIGGYKRWGETPPRLIYFVDREVFDV